MEKLEKQIEKSEMFKNTYVYIDEFNGFTSQEYNIIRKIEKGQDDPDLEIRKF